MRMITAGRTEGDCAFRSAPPLESRALIELVGSLVLQGDRQLDAFAALVGLSDDVTQDPPTDPMILMRGLYLYFS